MRRQDSYGTQRLPSFSDTLFECGDFPTSPLAVAASNTWSQCCTRIENSGRESVSRESFCLERSCFTRAVSSALGEAPTTILQTLSALCNIPLVLFAVELAPSRGVVERQTLLHNNTNTRFTMSCNHNILLNTAVTLRDVRQRSIVEWGIAGFGRLHSRSRSDHRSVQVPRS
jgi:hypothetical protein